MILYLKRNLLLDKPILLKNRLSFNMMQHDPIESKYHPESADGKMFLGKFVPDNLILLNFIVVGYALVQVLVVQVHLLNVTLHDHVAACVANGLHHLPNLHCIPHHHDPYHYDIVGFQQYFAN